MSIDSPVGSSGGEGSRQYEKNNLRNFRRISDVTFPDGYRTARPSIHPLRDMLISQNKRMSCCVVTVLKWIHGSHWFGGYLLVIILLSR